MKIRTLFCFALCICGFEGCKVSQKSSDGKLTSQTTSLNDLESIIENQLPIGTPVETVRDFMEREGFHVHQQVDSDYRYAIVHPNGKKERRIISNVDYLACSKTTQRGLVATVNIVAFILDDRGMVSQVVYSQEFVGV